MWNKSVLALLERAIGMVFLHSFKSLGSMSAVDRMVPLQPVLSSSVLSEISSAAAAHKDSYQRKHVH